jgi:hypothetical protein
MRSKPISAAEERQALALALTDVRALGGMSVLAPGQDDSKIPRDWDGYQRLAQTGVRS